MSSCPQCHAEFSPEDLDAEHPTCPVCGERFEADEDFSETEEHDPLKSAPKIDGFEITRHIGRGGMGDVWEARQNVLGRKVAIKVLAKNLSHSEHFLARFTREAYTLGRLQHPGIVSIYDFRSSPDGLCCIIMEYVEGQKRGEPSTLYDLIVAKELTPDRTRFLILQVLHSLEYAHAEGVIHRDIKPTNVLIDRFGRVKVVDFGIAAMPSDPNRKQLTYVGGPLGTAEYMAPEQTEDATKADHRADLYAVGVVIYEMLTGMRPRGVFAMPSKIKPELTPAWDNVITKALQPDREHRYANAAEMIEAIQAIQSGGPPANIITAAEPFFPPGAGAFPAPIGELPFDEEPEEFPGQKTPLPAHTPTSDNADMSAHVLIEDTPARPSDTDPLLEENDPHIPAWMIKRRDRAASVEDTQADSIDEEVPEAAEAKAAGSDSSILASSLHLDRRELEAKEESSDDIPAADVRDLDEWLAPGPAPKSQSDSSHLIEVAAHLVPAEEQSAEAEEQPESDDPAIEESAKVSGGQPAPTGTSGILTTEDTGEGVAAPLEPPAVEDLPEGHFIELCYHAALSPKSPRDKAILFRPAIRPPTIKICVLDDGSHREGEWLRIRQPRFVIGRKEGDLVISHDRNISSRHAEISLRDAGDGISEFFIQDLNTTNGTFARASRATLEDGQEFLLGFRRYKLVLNCRDEPGQPSYDKLVEVKRSSKRKGKPKSFRLDKQPIVIGRDPQKCNLLILDDPFLSPVHAVLKKDQRGRWAIKNYNSKNGIWIKIDEMKLVSGGEFQIGGQRLIVLLP